MIKGRTKGRSTTSDVIVTVGLGLAKNVFQVHGVDADGRVCVRRKLRRAEITPFFAGLSPWLCDFPVPHTANPDALKATAAELQTCNEGMERISAGLDLD